MDLLLSTQATNIKYMRNGSTHCSCILRGITIPTAFALVGFYALYLLRTWIY